MSPVLWRLALVTLGGLLLGLEACTSTPSRFYVLSSLSASETIAATAATQGPVIGVGPITLPKYLDRPQIVTRAGSNQLALAEFDRWAEPLQDNVARVLAENLAPPHPHGSGPAAGLAAVCYPRLSGHGGSPAFRWLVRW